MKGMVSIKNQDKGGKRERKKGEKEERRREGKKPLPFPFSHSQQRTRNSTHGAHKVICNATSANDTPSPCFLSSRHVEGTTTKKGMGVRAGG